MLPIVEGGDFGKVGRASVLVVDMIVVAVMHEFVHKGYAYIGTKGMKAPIIPALRHVVYLSRSCKRVRFCRQICLSREC